MSTPMSLFDLVELFEKSGCPVCQLIEKDVNTYLYSLLFEGYRFPENHEKFWAGRGLCNPHAWFLEDRYKGALLNIGVYYRGALNQVVKALAAGASPAAAPRSGFSRLLGGPSTPSSAMADKLEPEGSCIACEIHASTELRTTRTLGQFIADKRLASAYRKSPEGVCLPHFRMALRHATTRNDEQTLMDIQRKIWESLIEQLDEFKEMHDHRHTGEFMGEEGDSWLRALRAMAGNSGMFGTNFPKK